MTTEEGDRDEMPSTIGTKSGGNGPEVQGVS